MDLVRTRSPVRAFTLLELMIVVSIIAVIAAMALPILFKSRMAANEASAVGTLRMIVSVQEQYRQMETGGKRYCTRLTHLADLLHLDEVVGASRKSGYYFTLLTEPMSSDGFIDLWNAAASPCIWGKTGKRYFFVDNVGILRFHGIHPAGPTDEPLD